MKRWQPRLGLLLWLVLLLPPARHGLEASMTRHMLVQIPLLALAGWWLAPALPARLKKGIARWNRAGISGLLLVSLASLAWMLPRTMDAAIISPWAEAAKFASVPLLIGLALALSWPRAGFIVRGLFLLEWMATLFRAGWLYLAAPQQLCANYLVRDQQRLGWILVALGAGLLLVVGWKLLFGHARAESV